MVMGNAHLMRGVARLGGLEFDCAGQNWIGWVDKMWAVLG